MAASSSNNVSITAGGDALLQRALAALERNDFATAEFILGGLLSTDPENFNALQLMGVMRRTQGRDQEAEDFYRRSLKANSHQPHVHHNLGNLLRTNGRFAEAVEAQRQALAQKPNYVEAHLGLALALSDMGENLLAEKSLRRVLHMDARHTLAKQTLGAVLNAQNRPKEAQSVLESALVGVDDVRQLAALEYNLGVSASMQGQHEKALQLFEVAQRKVPGIPFADYNRGNALQNLGRNSEAVQAYRRAVASNPLNSKAHAELNHLLYRAGDDQNFLKSYDEALSRFPNIAGLVLDKATFLFHQEKYEDARELYARAARFDNANVMPWDGLGLVHARLGEFEPAIHAHEQALKLEPENAHAWRNFSETLLRAGDATKALSAAETSLSLEPEHQGAIALWGTALWMLDDPRERSLNDFDLQIREFEVRPPRGFSDIETFNAELNSYLDQLHKDRREVITQTLRGGTQTLDNVFGKNHDLVERLRESIDLAVADYIAEMPDDETHLFYRRRQGTFGYSGSWSSRLRDCGFHTNHFHTKGWISSAYYISLPEVTEDVHSKQGWIKFGEPAFDTQKNGALRRSVQPKSGTLVLFPSYMWHGTNPFHAAHDRTTIAFDVVPKTR